VGCDRVISKELLGRAHGALSVAGNGPCVGVLRELVEAIEAEGGGSDYPTLYYRSREVQVNLGLATVDYLQRRSGVELRFMHVLLERAQSVVLQAWNSQDRSATGEQDPAGSGS
jgi:hypothetical protein